MSEPSNYIAVTGNMGSGKTSLVDFLSKKLSIKPIMEAQDENPYIKDFYSDMKRWAFHSQLFFLLRKIQFYNIIKRSHEILLLDRTIYEDAEIFAKALYNKRFISKRDFNLYNTIYHESLKGISPPRVMIYCFCSTGCILSRIQKRGRDYESRVGKKYVAYLNRLYRNWRRQYNLSPVIDINTEEMDYFSNFIDRLDMMNKVAKYL